MDQRALGVDGLDVLRKDVLAVSQNDQLLAAADDVQIAFRVDVAEIAGPEEAILGERFARRLGVLPVALEHVRAARLDLALALGDVRGGRDAQLDALDGATRRVEPRPAGRIEGQESAPSRSGRNRSAPRSPDLRAPRPHRDRGAHRPTRADGAESRAGGAGARTGAGRAASQSAGAARWKSRAGLDSSCRMALGRFFSRLSMPPSMASYSRGTPIMIVQWHSASAWLISAPLSPAGRTTAAPIVKGASSPTVSG